MVNEFKLTLADQQFLQQQIAKAEKITQAEIIVGVTRRSSDYNVAAVLVAAFVSLGLATTLVMAGWWHFSFVSLQLTQIALGLGVYTVLVETGWVCHVVPDVFLHRAVRRMARDMFFDQDLQLTRQRNALLIFVSLRERRIELLPDKVLQQHVPFQVWDDLLQTALRKKGKGNLTHWLAETLHNCALMLKNYDPAHTSNPDEIPNTIRFV